MQFVYNYKPSKLGAEKILAYFRVKIGKSFFFLFTVKFSVRITSNDFGEDFKTE